MPLTGSGYYVVKRGDTLWSIARNNGISVDKLKELNNLASNLLNIGDVLKIKEENSVIPNESGNPSYYTVKKGDTLYSIASEYKTTVDKIKRLNNLTSNTLSIGQSLLLTDTPVTSNTYIVQKGDTLYGIANTYNVTVADLKSLNNLNTNVLTIGEVLKIPTNSEKVNISTKTYTVQKGDTLYNIAKTFNVSVAEIKNLNNLNTNILSIGQKLNIPE